MELSYAHFSKICSNEHEMKNSKKETVSVMLTWRSV